VHLPRKQQQSEDSLRTLLQAALAVPSSPMDSSPGSSKENHARQTNGDTMLDEKEAKQLLAVKKLIEIKGFDSMMKFLGS
jgi:hypothetical protein